MSTQRVSSSEVQAIFPTSVDLQPFIETATVIVSERLAGHYTEARLTEIERWLTAHLACSSAGSSSSGGSGEISSIRADEITVSYATTQLGSGLDGSRYGQHLKLLDFKGLLAQSMHAVPTHFSVH